MHKLVCSTQRAGCQYEQVSLLVDKYILEAESSIPFYSSLSPTKLRDKRQWMMAVVSLRIVEALTIRFSFSKQYSSRATTSHHLISVIPCPVSSAISAGTVKSSRLKPSLNSSSRQAYSSSMRSSMDLHSWSQRLACVCSKLVCAYQ